jgi:exodeoxyribonuclease V beta subunit
MHKSKGLEAAVVFVAGGLGAPRGGDGLSLCHEAGRRVAYVGGVADPLVRADVEREADEERRRLLYVALTRARARLYLPYFGPLPDAPPAAEFKVAGAYKVVHDRLCALLAGDGPRRRLFVDAPAPSGGAPVSAAPAAPPPLPPEIDDSARFVALRQQHAGYIVTSYSRLAAAEGAHLPREPEPADFDAEPETLAPADDAEDLPGGTATGVYLHEVLENLPVAAGAVAPDLARWQNLPENKAVLEACGRRHDIAPRHWPRAAQMVHAALWGPVDTGARRIAGIGASARVLREMEFLYPIPEDAHPRLGEVAGEREFTIGRGFVKGFIDVLFEHEGRTYLGDWKSDRLRDYGPEALAEHVREHYGTQIRLYFLALLRLLGIAGREDYERRVGGMVYTFLRAVRPDGDGRAGLHFVRPDWSELTAWERELAGRDYGPARGAAGEVRS